MKIFKLQGKCSAFSKTRLPPELRRVLSCESPAVFLHIPLKEKGNWGPFYQLRRVQKKRKTLTSNLTERTVNGNIKAILWFVFNYTIDNPPFFR